MNMVEWREKNGNLNFLGLSDRRVSEKADLKVFLITNSDASEPVTGLDKYKGSLLLYMFRE